MRQNRKLYYGWVIVGVSFITMSLVSPIGTLFRLFYKAFKDEFAWSHASISGIFGLHQFLNGAISPLVGWLIDRYGPRRVMPAGALLLGAGLAASSRVNSLFELYIAFGLIAAFGVASLQSVPNVAIVSNWFVKNRGTAVGIVLAGSGLGEFVLIPATQWLILNVGWRGTLLLLALLVFIVPATLVLIFQRHSPADKGLSPYGEGEQERQGARHEVVVVDKAWAETSWTLGRAVRTRRYWALVMMVFIFSLGYFLIAPQLFVFTQEFEQFQAHSVFVAFVLGAAGLQEGVAKFTGGVIADRFGREMTMTMSAVLIVGGIWMLSFLEGNPSVWLLYLAVLFYGLGYGFSLPSIMSSCADLFQGPRFGSILGSLTLGGLFGAALGASAGGYLRDVTGGFETSFVISTIAFAASVALIWSARPGGVRVVRKVALAREGRQDAALPVAER
ncbi:MAG TPA: MFS transporter [Blastocatellia bacterium]|nr:MFS transporter [Blastocatellia bacterium]